ncbi:MAG: redox-sensing transcriptional repressor Rex [Candidatus Sumerlaeia bacterium]
MSTIPSTSKRLESKTPSGEGKKIPKAVIKRLSLYSRVLQNLEIKKQEKVSSQYIAEQLGLTSAQVRKDLGYFGQFGVPGIGYYVTDLRNQIKKILGTHREVRVGLVGAGHLGQALLNYAGFSRQGFNLVAAFDEDRRKLGRQVGQAEIFAMDDLEKIIKKKNIELVILTIPASVAQPIVDRLVACGIKAILNFVPRRLIVPPDVKVHYVDLTIEIESLSYYLK